MATGDEARELPTVLKIGFERYAVEGPYAAATAWIQGGPLALDAEALLGTVNLLKNIENRYGSYFGYQLLRSEKISDRTMLHMVEMRYALGPLYAKFLCYQTDQGGWVVTGKLNFTTDPTISK